MKKISKIPRSSLIFVLAGFVIFTSIGVFLTPKVFQDGYIQLFPLIFVTFFYVLGGVSLVVPFLEKKTILFDEHMEIKQFGRVTIIDYIDIGHFEELGRPRLRRYQNVGKYIILCTSNGRFKIGSAADSNYTIIEQKLREYQIPKKAFTKSRKGQIIASVILLSIISLISYFGIRSYLFPDTVLADELVFFKGVLSKNSDGFETNNNSDILYFEGYPEYDFFVETYDVLSYNSFSSSVKKGDTLVVGLKKNEHAVKIEGTMEPRFWDKQSWSSIAVYTIEHNQFFYLSLDQYNAKQIEDSEVLPYVLPFLLLSLIASLISVWLKKK